MIYVEIVSRMADQMRLYAFARNLQLKIKRQQKEKIAFDFSRYNPSKYEQQMEDRTKYYKLSHFKCDDNITMAERKMNPIQRLVLKLYFGCPNFDHGKYEEKWRDLMSIFGVYICTYNFHKFKYKSLFKNVLVLGFYSSHDFFREIDDVIKDELSLKEENYSAKTIELIAELEKPNSVCVSIRRGDFASPELAADMSLNLDYYYKGIKKMKEINPNSKFFFFSDDREWILNNVDLPENSVMIQEKELNVKDYEIIHIKSHCPNHIMANSGFTWWSVVLCDKKDKVIIAPSKWTNITYELYTALYENDWILID